MEVGVVLNSDLHSVSTLPSRAGATDFLRRTKTFAREPTRYPNASWSPRDPKDPRCESHTLRLVAVPAFGDPVNSCSEQVFPARRGVAGPAINETDPHPAQSTQPESHPSGGQRSGQFHRLDHTTGGPKPLVRSHRLDQEGVERRCLHVSDGVAGQDDLL